MGVDRGTVIRIEAGRDSFLVDQAVKATLHLRVPLAWLFSDEWTRSDGSGAGSGEWADDPPPMRHP